MIGEATTLESSPAGIDGDGFDVFASLRGGVESDNFSSGAGEAGGADTDEAVSGLDLVAVAGGKEKLDTTMSDTNSNNSSEISTPVGPDLCEKFGTIACVGCDFALLCAELTSISLAISSGLGSRPNCCKSWREMRMSLLMVRHIPKETQFP